MARPAASGARFSGVHWVCLGVAAAEWLFTGTPRIGVAAKQGRCAMRATGGVPPSP